MGIKTVPQPPYSPDLSLFPMLRGCRYVTIEELKVDVTKVIDMLAKEDLHGAFHQLLERYNKCIAAGGDYFEGDESFMCVKSIKVLIRKKSGNLSYAPRISIHIYYSCDADKRKTWGTQKGFMEKHLYSSNRKKDTSEPA